MHFTCIVIDDEPHAILEISELVESSPDLKLIKTFSSARKAIEFVEGNGPVDIVFSDIEMPGLTGLQAAQELRPFCRFLVFVTAYRNHALQAFAENVSGYLLKPLGNDEFTELINRFKKQDEALLASIKHMNEERESDDVFFVKGGLKNSFIPIDLSSVQYIEAYANYSRIVMGQKSEMTYMGIGQFSEQLKPFKIFFRINKSIIIGIQHIKAIEDNKVYLKSGEEFGIGRVYQASFFEFIKERSLNFLDRLD